QFSFRPEASRSTRLVLFHLPGSTVKRWPCDPVTAFWPVTVCFRSMILESLWPMAKVQPSAETESLWVWPTAFQLATESAGLSAWPSPRPKALESEWSRPFRWGWGLAEAAQAYALRQIPQAS